MGPLARSFSMNVENSDVAALEKGSPFHVVEALNLVSGRAVCQMPILSPDIGAGSFSCRILAIAVENIGPAMSLAVARLEMTHALEGAVFVVSAFRRHRSNSPCVVMQL